VARRIGHVFQMPEQNLLDYLDVTAQVRLAWRMRGREVPGAVDELVATVGLDDVADEVPSELAAGQQQRLAFAMAVAGRPALVVADEPTASLDPEGADILISLLDRLRATGESLVVSTHDRRLMELADQMLVIRGGVLVAAGPPGDAMPAVIDASGRLALTVERAAVFPARRARIVDDGDELRITQP
jgi:putative ABC transport system ATP-binding protein